MVFPETTLELEHESGCVLSFVTLDALKPIDTTQEPLKVATAENWVKTRYWWSLFVWQTNLALLHVEIESIGLLFWQTSPHLGTRVEVSGN